MPSLWLWVRWPFELQSTSLLQLVGGLTRLCHCTSSGHLNSPQVVAAWRQVLQLTSRLSGRTLQSSVWSPLAQMPWRNHWPGESVWH